MKTTFIHLAAIAATISSVVAAPATSASNSTSVDYVIVGGGPAGLVLLEQLSRNPRIRVTLIEAGPDASTDPAVTTPAEFLNVIQYLSLYNSQPDPNLGGLAPNLWQGKVLGGGTAVNAMLYCRGSSSVFDEWAQLSGNSGLAWNSLLDSFRATSHYKEQPDASYPQVVTTSVYGNGPVEVSRTGGLTGFEFPFANAIESALGVEEIDMTDGRGIGVDLGLNSIRVSNRTRSYAHNTFGFIAGARRNVRIINGATVTKINFSGSTATGVTYVSSNGTSIDIRAKEVVVSGGAINSPKLLMLSGVGPASTLEALQIPVVLDAPDVGRNLQDHHFSAIELQVTDDILTYWQFTANETGRAIAEQQYAHNYSGPLGWQNGDVFAGVRIPDSVFSNTGSNFYPSLPADRPQVLYEFLAIPIIQPAPNVSLITTWATLVQPEGSGYITLNSNNWRDDPLIYSNYYGTDSDKAAIVHAYNELRNIILKSPAVQPYIVEEIFPGPNVTSEADVWSAIQQTAQSFHHPVGTVAIGKVLDANWRIKGLKGIRVVDSSAIPTLPTCHTQAHAYAIAHRAALDILRDDRQQY